MNPSERNPEWSRRENSPQVFADLHRLRVNASNRLGTALKPVVNIAAENFTREYIPHMLPIFSNPEFLKVILKRQRTNLPPKDNSTPANLTPFVLLFMESSMFKDALYMHENYNDLYFAVIYDAAMGIKTVRTALVGAHYKKGVIFDEEMKKLEEEFIWTKDRDPAEQAELFFALRTTNNNYSKLLINDPSGINVVNTAVELLRKTPDQKLAPSFKELVIAGAKVGAEVHKATLGPIGELLDFD